MQAMIVDFNYAVTEISKKPYAALEVILKHELDVMLARVRKTVDKHVPVSGTGKEIAHLLATSEVLAEWGLLGRRKYKPLASLDGKLTVIRKELPTGIRYVVNWDVLSPSAHLIYTARVNYIFTVEAKLT